MTTVLCITGMHRSGTSLTASWIESCGLNIHDSNLIGPARSNPKGHFEDQGFVDLHSSAILLENPKSSVWKDLRSVMYLRQWKEIIPSLKVLFVWRPCSEVAQSLTKLSKKTHKTNYI